MCTHRVTCAPVKGFMWIDMYFHNVGHLCTWCGNWRAIHSIVLRSAQYIQMQTCDGYLGRQWFDHALDNSYRHKLCTMRCNTWPHIAFVYEIFTLVTQLYLFTYSLTPRSTALLEKLTRSQLVQKFPAFYGIPKFITAFTSARHMSVSLARSIQPMPPNPTSWRYSLILFSHLSRLRSRGGAVGWSAALQAERSRGRFPMM
jgi:hypothetical protein